MSAFLNKRRRLFLASLACAAVLRSSAPAATTDALIEEAKREGEVVYYASMNLSEANALIGAFEKRYPFIKVKLNRTGSEKLLTRVLTKRGPRRTLPTSFKRSNSACTYSAGAGYSRATCHRRIRSIRRNSKKKDFGPRPTTTPT